MRKAVREHLWPQEVETTQLPTNGGVDKQKVVYPLTGIVFSHEED